MKQHTTYNEFYTKSKDGKIEKVGGSVILQPKTNFNGTDGIKWFDDSKLIRKSFLQKVS